MMDFKINDLTPIMSSAFEKKNLSEEELKNICEVKMERVEHPDYYNQGRIECIDLLSRICDGYNGIFAFDIGQCKYVYRAGDKTEEGINNIDKAIEDYKKMKFYLNDFKKRAEEGNAVEININKNSVEAELIANEFSYNKEDKIKDDVKEFIKTIYNLKTFNDIDKALEILDNIISKLEEEKSGK